MTGANAWTWLRELDARVKAVAALVKGDAASVESKVRALVERARGLEKDVELLKAKLASSQGGDLAAQAVEVAGVRVLAARLDGADAKTLRETIDQLKNKLHSAAVVLATVEDGKVAFPRDAEPRRGAQRDQAFDEKVTMRTITSPRELYCSNSSLIAALATVSLRRTSSRRRPSARRSSRRPGRAARAAPRPGRSVPG